MIVLLKLTDGTDVIGKMIENTEYEIKLADAMRITFNFPRFDMPPVIYCQKWSPFLSSYDVTFKHIHVMTYSTEIDEIITEYYHNMLEYTKENFKLMVRTALEVAEMQDEPEDENDEFLEELFKTKKKDLH